MAWIMTHDEARRTRWIKLFGVERLPVKVAKPRWQHHPFSAAMVYAYDLDAARLPSGARSRFAHYVAAKTGQAYEAALYQVDGWPIPAAGCTVETAVSSKPMIRPFVLPPAPTGAYA